MSLEQVELGTATPKWVSTALTTIGAGLTTVLLVWIASSQVELITRQAVILNNQEAIRMQINETTTAQRDQMARMELNLNRVWPRLRTHGENIAILTREIEVLCKCKIILKLPEEY